LAQAILAQTVYFTGDSDMPPPRSKKPNPRSRGKHVSSFEEVQQRNRAEAAGEGGESRGPAKDESEDEDSQEKPEEKSQASSKTSPQAIMGGGNLNAKARNVEKEGVELSRKQREEIEKEAARRRYEELHKAGKTDEAKADLARLEEVKKRREEAAKKKVEQEEAQKAAELQQQSKKSLMSAEVKDALGGEAARIRGERSQVKRREKGPDLYAALCEGAEKAAPTERPATKDGSIQACRAAEDDFM